jgi:hypothetical protein
MFPIGLRVFVVGLELWYHLQTYWFSGNFRLQAAGVLLLYWALGCLVVFTREKPTGPISLEQSPAGTEETRVQVEPHRLTWRPAGAAKRRSLRC